MTMETDDLSGISLYAAIAWALHLADGQGQTLIAAYLSDALALADKI